MSQSKRKPPKKSSTRIEPAKRNAVNFLLDEAEHRRITAETIQVGKAAGIDVTLGKYAKHALLSHRRLRSIEADVRELMKRWDHDAETGKEFEASLCAEQLRAILETAVAG